MELWLIEPESGYSCTMRFSPAIRANRHRQRAGGRAAPRCCCRCTRQSFRGCRQMDQASSNPLERAVAAVVALDCGGRLGVRVIGRQPVPGHVPVGPGTDRRTAGRATCRWCRLRKRSQWCRLRKRNNAYGGRVTGRHPGLADANPVAYRRKHAALRRKQDRS